MDRSLELRALDAKGVSKHSEHIGSSPVTSDSDKDVLARLGKLPVLQRNFGFMSILGFTCTILISWEAVLLAFEVPILNGGPAGYVYGFIFVWAGTLASYASLSELASMAPTAGGQYHWVSMLAPPSSHKFLSYLTGWLTVIGWQGSFATANFVSANVIQGLIVLTHPSYDPKPWQTMLLFWAVMAFAVFINLLASTVLPKFEGLILVLHVFGFFAVLFPLVILGKRQDAHQVLNLWMNEGHLPTQGISFFVGLLGPIFMFLGADGAVHMSEEIENAPKVVPWSILSSLIINGCLAFVMLIVTLLYTEDLDGALNSKTGYAFMAIFQQATGSTAGAATMASIITVAQLFANVGLLASCSRMTWSFARDRGLPGYQWLERVNPSTSIPVQTIIVSSAVSLLLSLIILGSSTAFNNIVSIAVAGLFTSYIVAVALLLWRRLTGGIHRVENAKTNNRLINSPGNELVWGPWYMPGLSGPAMNLFALAYMVLILFFSFWPSELPVTAANMNYSVLVTVVVVAFSVGWYEIYARKIYTGPVIQTAE